MLAALRIETATSAIDVAGQDLTFGPEIWTAVPDLGETTLSAADSRRELDYMHADTEAALRGGLGMAVLTFAAGRRGLARRRVRVEDWTNGKLLPRAVNAGVESSLKEDPPCA